MLKSAGKIKNKSLGMILTFGLTVLSQPMPTAVWKHVKFLCILHNAYNCVPLRNMCLILIFKVNGYMVDCRKYRRCKKIGKIISLKI